MADEEGRKEGQNAQAGCTVRLGKTQLCNLKAQSPGFVQYQQGRGSQGVCCDEN